MVALIILGSAIAFIHHLSNKFLSEKTTAEYPQMWVKNLDLAAAFFVKCSFAAAINLAFQETLWEALRARSTRIRSLDKLFTVQSNPFSFFSIDAFKTASSALVMAAIQWSIPIAAIFAPGTLNVRISSRETVNTQCHVPTFNNTLGRTWFPGGLGVKVMHTPDLDLWSYQTVIPGHIASVPSSTFCGPNCTYAQTFVAPHMMCYHTDNLTSHDIVLSDPDDLHRCNLSSETACSLYGSTGMDSTTPDGDEFSITYAELYEQLDKYQLSMNYSRIVCNYTHAYYDLSIEYTNDIPTHNISITPFPLPAGFHADYDRMPQKDQDLWDLEVTARGLFHYFHVFWIGGRLQLYKSPSKGDVLKFVGHSKIIYSPLCQITPDYKLKTTQDLAVSVPELFRNFTISTFLLKDAPTNTTTCTRNHLSSVYHYESIGLVVPYSTAAALSVICVMAGVMALRANGTPTKQIFSQLLITNRNEKLEGVLGRKEMETHEKVLEDRRLRLENVKGRSIFVVEEEGHRLVI